MKIAISGSFGVGKSTLFGQLRERFGQFEYIFETTREVMQEHGLTNEIMTLEQRVRHQLVSTRRQIEYEQKCSNFITDYCSLDYLNYTRGLTVYDTLRAEVTSHLKIINGYDVIFYIPIEFGLVRDGLRFEDESFRVQIDSGIRQLFQEFKIFPVILSGTQFDRLKLATRAIENFLLDKTF